MQFYAPLLFFKQTLSLSWAPGKVAAASRLENNKDTCIL